jgi:hypothetical protein
MQKRQGAAALQDAVAPFANPVVLWLQYFWKRTKSPSNIVLTASVSYSSAVAGDGSLRRWAANNNIGINNLRIIMIPEYNRKSLAFGIPGLLLQIGCQVAINLMATKAKAGGGALPADLVFLFLAGALVGTILLITGLCYYAKGKGYSGVLGLLGLLSCLGLLILAILPDKTK